MGVALVVQMVRVGVKPAAVPEAELVCLVKDLVALVVLVPQDQQAVVVVVVAPVVVLDVPVKGLDQLPETHKVEYMVAAVAVDVQTLMVVGVEQSASFGQVTFVHSHLLKQVTYNESLH